MDAKAVSTWLGILAALGAIWARFIALEERGENQLRWITETSGEMRRLKERVESLERDRVMLERVHAIELRLGSLEERGRGR